MCHGTTPEEMSADRSGDSAAVIMKVPQTNVNLEWSLDISIDVR
jgi:hypothetical protein